MNNFSVLVARFTLFPQLGTQVGTAAELYQRLWSRLPDSFQTIQPGPFPGTIAYGNVEELQFVVQQQPARLDLTFQPQVRDEVLDVARFGSDVDLYRRFADLADKLPKALEGTRLARVASYLQLGCVADDPIEANQRLLTTLPDGFSLPLQTEEDLILQLNYPRASRHSDGIRMNYIVKWSSEQVTMMTVTPPAPIPLVKTFLMSTISLDNSSSATRQEPLGAQLSFELLRESFEEFRSQLHDLKVSIKGF